MKKIGVISLLMFVVGSFALAGCAAAPLAAMAGKIATSGLESKAKNNQLNKTRNLDQLIEEYSIGENTVKLSIISHQGVPGYIFDAYDKNKRYIGNVFYRAEDKNDMIEYEAFNKMDGWAKKQYIRETFVKFHNTDLEPVNLSPSPAPNIDLKNVTTGFAK